MKINSFFISYLINNNLILYFSTKKNGKEWKRKRFLLNSNFFRNVREYVILCRFLLTICTLKISNYYIFPNQNYKIFHVIWWVRYSAIVYDRPVQNHSKVQMLLRKHASFVKRFIQSHELPTTSHLLLRLRSTWIHLKYI